MFLFAATTAQAESFNKYIGAQAAIADVDNMDNGVAAVVTYGSRVPEVSKRFFVEGEVTTTVVDPERPGVEISYYTLGGYAVYAPQISDSVSVRGRAGILYQNISVSGSGKSDNDFELSFGFGATMKMSDSMNLIIDYTVHDSDISHISAGLQIKI